MTLAESDATDEKEAPGGDQATMSVLQRWRPGAMRRPGIKTFLIEGNLGPIVARDERHIRYRTAL